MIRKRLAPTTTIRKTSGHGLLEAFEATVADHQARADARMDAINARLAELEREQAALLTLRRRLHAAALEA